jgi:hypothetical protein
VKIVIAASISLIDVVVGFPIPFDAIAVCNKRSWLYTDRAGH